MYVPDRVVTNAELSARLGENVDEFLRDTLGIRERHFCSEQQATSDLATEAGRQALARAGIAPEEVNWLIVATDTPEYISPPTAAVVQSNLGLRNAMFYDLNTACAGFVTALDQGAKQIITEPAFESVLVIGAYAMSKYINWTDKYTSTMFADGAGAVVLRPLEGKPAYLGAVFEADGSYHDFIGVYGGGTRFPSTPASLEKGEQLLQFKKRFPREFNVEHWPALIERLMKKIGRRVQDINLILFTQINLSAIRDSMARLGLSMERTHYIMDRWGYTGSACIPMALDDAVQKKKLKPGDLLVMCASGGGFAMGASAFYWA